MAVPFFLRSAAKERKKKRRGDGTTKVQRNDWKEVLAVQKEKKSSLLLA